MSAHMLHQHKMVVLHTMGSASQGIIVAGSSPLVGQNGFDWSLERSSMPGRDEHIPKVQWYSIYRAGTTPLVLGHSPSLLRKLRLDFLGEPAALPVSSLFHHCVPTLCYW